MITTLLSFFGGSAFRALWGEISAFLSRRQDQKYEMERMRLQGNLDAEAHARNMTAIELQHKLGVEVIRVQGDVASNQTETEAWKSLIESMSHPTGIWLVDLWNGLVRPVLATVCTGLVVLHFYRADWVLDQQGWALVGAVLGVYVADRTLFKRGR